MLIQPAKMMKKRPVMLQSGKEALRTEKILVWVQEWRMDTRQRRTFHQLLSTLGRKELERRACALALAAHNERFGYGLRGNRCEVQL